MSKHFGSTKHFFIYYCNIFTWPSVDQHLMNYWSIAIATQQLIQLQAKLLTIYQTNEKFFMFGCFQFQTWQYKFYVICIYLTCIPSNIFLIKAVFLTWCEIVIHTLAWIKTTKSSRYKKILDDCPTMNFSYKHTHFKIFGLALHFQRDIKVTKLTYYIHCIPFEYDLYVCFCFYIIHVYIKESSTLSFIQIWLFLPYIQLAQTLYVTYSLFGNISI